MKKTFTILTLFISFSTVTAGGLGGTIEKVQKTTNLAGSAVKCITKNDASNDACEDITDEATNKIDDVKEIKGKAKDAFNAAKSLRKTTP